MKKLIHILTYVLPALCLLLLLSVLIIPRVTGLRFAEVVSGSMEPTIKTGASIAIAPVDPAQVKDGDIIGFKIPGIDTPICHRVVGIVRSGDSFDFVTQGDAQKVPDPWLVQPQNVVGKVYLSASRLFPAARFINSMPGHIVTIFLPGMLAAFLLLRDVFRQQRRGNLPQPPG